MAEEPQRLLARASFAEYAQSFELAATLTQQALSLAASADRLRVANACAALHLNHDRDFAPKGLELCASEPDADPVERVRAKALLASLYARMHAFERCRRNLSDARRVLDAGSVTEENQDIFYWMARAHFELGEYEAARRLAMRVVAASEPYDASAIVAQAHNVLGRVALNTHADRETLARYGATAVANAREVGNGPQIEAYLARRCIYAFYAADLAAMEGALTAWDCRSLETRNRYIDVARFVAHVSTGAYEEAAYWSRHLPFDEFASVEDVYVPVAAVLLVGVLADDPGVAAGIDVLAEPEPAFLHASRARHRSIAGLVLHLYRVFVDRDDTEAPPELTECADDPVVELVRRIVGAIVRSVHVGSEVPRIDFWVRELHRSVYGLLALLLQAVAEHARSRAAQCLTATERAILAELSSGDTPQAIAVRRCCSRNTVRTHIQHIYKKLGVNTKIEAINRLRSSRL